MSREDGDFAEDDIVGALLLDIMRSALLAPLSGQLSATRRPALMPPPPFAARRGVSMNSATILGPSINSNDIGSLNVIHIPTRLPPINEFAIIVGGGIPVDSNFPLDDAFIFGESDFTDDEGDEGDEGDEAEVEEEDAWSRILYAGDDIVRISGDDDSDSDEMTPPYHDPDDTDI